MKLQILRVAERGLANRERVHLTVLQATNLTYYVILLTRYLNPNAIANGSLAAFWFPSQAVQAGDQVILFSGSGSPTTQKESNGSTTYFFYWGFNQTVWNHSANCAVVIEAGSWATSPQGG